MQIYPKTSPADSQQQRHRHRRLLRLGCDKVVVQERSPLLCSVERYTGYQIKKSDLIRIRISRPFYAPKSRLRQRWNPELGNLSKTASEILEGRWERCVRVVALGKDAIVRAELSRLRASVRTQHSRLLAGILHLKQGQTKA